MNENETNEENPMLDLVNNEAIEYPAYTKDEDAFTEIYNNDKNLEINNNNKKSNQPVFVTTPILKESNKPGFNNNDIQDARVNDDLEGGIARPSTMQFSEKNNPQEEGYIVKYNKPKIETDKWEVSGFSVMVGSTQGVEISNFFDDLETAKRSVVGNSYLMPTEKSYKLTKINKGAPIITYNEQQLFMYINNKWVNI
jgi:hypothetical protein